MRSQGSVMSKKNLPQICECVLCVMERVDYIAHKVANEILHSIECDCQECLAKWELVEK